MVTTDQNPLTYIVQRTTVIRTPEGYIIQVSPHPDGAAVTIHTPDSYSLQIEVLSDDDPALPCNDMCAISGEHKADCGAKEVCRWAPHRNLPKGGGVRCGCSSCADVYRRDYGCIHGVDDDCRCVENALE